MRLKSAWTRRLAMSAVGALAATSLAVAVPSPAAAEEYNGYCSTGEFCLWYYSNQTGAISDWYYDRSDYYGMHFWSSSLWLDNNTMSARNNSYWTAVDLWELKNYDGVALNFGTRRVRNDLGIMNNKGSSHVW